MPERGGNGTSDHGLLRRFRRRWGVRWEVPGYPDVTTDTGRTFYRRRKAALYAMRLNSMHNPTITTTQGMWLVFDRQEAPHDRVQ